MIDVAATACAAVALVVAIRLLADLAAHVHRYRDYRRKYPAAERGKVWAHVARPRYRQW